MNEVKPGNAALRSGFRNFAFGDQRLAVGSRPAGRRLRVMGNHFLFAGEIPLHPSSKTFLTDGMTEILLCIADHFKCCELETYENGRMKIILKKKEYDG